MVGVESSVSQHLKSGVSEEQISFEEFVSGSKEKFKLDIKTIESFCCLGLSHILKSRHCNLDHVSVSDHFFLQLTISCATFLKSLPLFPSMVLLCLQDLFQVLLKEDAGAVRGRPHELPASVSGGCQAGRVGGCG